MRRSGRRSAGIAYPVMNMVPMSLVLVDQLMAETLVIDNLVGPGMRVESDFFGKVDS